MVKDKIQFPVFRQNWLVRRQEVTFQEILLGTLILKYLIIAEYGVQVAVIPLWAIGIIGKVPGSFNPFDKAIAPVIQE